MFWLRIAGALMVASMASTSARAQDIAASDIPSADIPTQVVDLQLERYRRMTVPVTIMGQGPYRFLIDTGAQATVISHTLADELQLTDRAPAMLVGMVSRREIETTTLPEMTFGAHSRSDAIAALVDHSNIGGADGILGLDSLQDRRILLDFKNLRMEVAEIGAANDNSSYDIIVRAQRQQGQLIIARARLNGVRVAVIVDTGAQGSIGNAQLARRMRRSRSEGESAVTDINGVQASGMVRIARSLDLGRAQLQNFPISFAPTPTFAALGLEDEPALILGMNELRVFERVAIDFPSRRVLFDLPDGTRMPSFAGADRFSRQ